MDEKHLLKCIELFGPQVWHFELLCIIAIKWFETNFLIYLFFVFILTLDSWCQGLLTVVSIFRPWLAAVMFIHLLIHPVNSHFARCGHTVPCIPHITCGHRFIFILHNTVTSCCAVVSWNEAKSLLFCLFLCFILIQCKFILHLLLTHFPS